MPQTAEAFLDEDAPSAAAFLSESPSAEAFLQDGASVTRMASATRATIGVVGRAVSALDMAMVDAVAPNTVENVDEFGRPLDPRGRNPAQLNPSLTESRTPDSALSQLMTPLVTLPRADLGIFGPSQANVPESVKAAAGAYNALKALPEFFSSPVGAALLASGNLPVIAQRLVAGGFAVDMARHTPEQVTALAKAVQGGNTQEIAETATALGINVGFVGLATKHALTKPNLAAAAGEALSESVKAAKFVDPKIAALRQVAPLTAEAVSKVAPEPTVAPKPGDVFQPGDFEAKPISPTPLTTEAVAKVVEKEPVPPPAPTPAAVASESGQKPAPVPAGVEPPAKPSVTPAVTIAKPEGERTLTTTAIDPSRVAITEIPVARLTLSKDVPNFKGGASEETGTVTGQELSGKYERTGTAPVVAWERLSGDLEIITGRHRLDLARRTGEKTIPTQIVREADGFTKEMALTFDAEANIRDGQGEVADYATYFKNTTISEAEAQQRGLLSRAKGKAGWSLAKAATDDVFALWRDGKLNDAQAVAIANAAPGNAAAQQIGSRFALQGKSSDFLSNVIKASQAEAGQRTQALDLFGKDDSAMVQMAEQAARAGQFQTDLRKTISAISGAAKNPEIARREGVDLKDPEAVRARVDALKEELLRWENWPLHQDLVAKVRGTPEAATIPKLRPGEKGTGDLLQGDEAPFNLSGEKGIDADRVAREKVDAEKRAAEAKVIADKAQTDLFAPVPEHLKPSKSTQAILDSQPATPPPEGGIKPKLAEAPEGGAILGIGGRRPAPPRPVGDTPRGDKNWLRIPSALRRVGRGLFIEGARAVLGRTRNQVGQELSRATRRHVDVEQELFGMHETVLRTAIRAIPRQRLDYAMTEASQYFREVENGRPATAISPEAQSLVDAWFAIGRSTGDIARANNVQVYDPALGAHRPMGNVANYVPRMFTAEVEAALRDPQADPVLFNRLAQEIATARGITLDEGAAELRGVAGRFQANDYMANLELARGAQMPELFYEYNLRNLAARYLPSFSERMAQIIAYGQRLGPRDAPQRQNLWDVARRESEDAYTQEWLNTAEDQGTGFKTKSTLERSARRMQALASATLLSDPTTTVPRNLLSGIAATTEAYGVGRSVRQFRGAMQAAARLGAREMGAIRDDLASFLNSDQLGDSALDAAIRGTSEFTLRASGFTGSENFVRTHNAMVASSFARDAAAALVANPASKLSREALAQFQRWNINPEAIITEGGNWRTGPETRRYIRTAVREMQGGYRFDQVPLWANSTAGRFFYQYGRWGVQRSQNIFQNIIRPFIGEDVQFRGQRMTSRDTLPLIRAAALMIGLGETFSAISSGLFGKDRRDSSLSEISEAWSEDELKAVGLIGERMINDIIMAGTLGIIGQTLDFAKAAKDQSRFKNPLDPPSASGIKTFIGLAQKAVDQDGTLTKKDLLEAASGIARGPKNVTDVVRNQIGESLYEGQNDQRTLRNAALRWAKETKEDVPIRGGGKDFRKSPTAPAYEAVNEALLAGDAEKARKSADKFIAESKDKAKARTALKSSVRARQPFRAGNLSSDAHQNEFMEWAEKNLSAADLEQIKRVQERYEKTASDAGLK